jgi:hypothetical protein
LSKLITFELSKKSQSNVAPAPIFSKGRKSRFTKKYF